MQVPVLPQVPLAPQRPCGSVTALATLAQVPALPVTLQAWQVGQAETSQQNPFVQLPVEHWLAPVKLPVACCATQVPPLQ